MLQVKTGTTNPILYSATIKGWYINLPTSGERVTGVPSVGDGIFLFNTIIPTASPCDFGGRGFVNAIDFLTGGMLSIPAFDTNRNRVLGLDDGLSAGIEIGFSVGGSIRMSGHSEDVLVTSLGNGEAVLPPTSPGPLGLRGRITWREFLP